MTDYPTPQVIKAVSFPPSPATVSGTIPIRLTPAGIVIAFDVT